MLTNTTTTITTIDTITINGFYRKPEGRMQQTARNDKKIHTKQHLPNQRSTSGSYTNITQIDPIPDDKFPPPQNKTHKTTT